MSGGLARSQRALEILLAAQRLRPVAFATSLSAEDMVITDLIARKGLSIEPFVLDTGMLHPDVSALVQRTEDRYGLKIRVVAPAPDAVHELVARQGLYGFYESLEARHACCQVRKVVPLNMALHGYGAWVTGLRREQAASRAGIAEVETDSGRSIPKYNPLADWSWGDVWAYVAAHDVPTSSLYERGYVSIGCDPCTRALRPREDPRAGRWWWEQEGAAKECGLHVTERST